MGNSNLTLVSYGGQGVHFCMCAASAAASAASGATSGALADSCSIGVGSEGAAAGAATGAAAAAGSGRVSGTYGVMADSRSATLVQPQPGNLRVMASCHSRVVVNSQVMALVLLFTRKLCLCSPVTGSVRATGAPFGMIAAVLTRVLCAAAVDAPA